MELSLALSLTSVSNKGAVTAPDAPGNELKDTNGNFLRDTDGNLLTDTQP